MNMFQLQEKFAYELGSTMEVDWDAVKVHYENMTVDGENHQMFVAIYFSRGIREQFDLTLEALDILEQLHNTQPTGQDEKWTWFDFEMNSAGKYDFFYKYGMPPQIAAVYGKRPDQDGK